MLQLFDLFRECAAVRVVAVQPADAWGRPVEQFTWKQSNSCSHARQSVELRRQLRIPARRDI